MKIQGKQLADILRSSTDAFTNVHSTTLTTTSIESVSNNNIEIEPHGSGATVIKGNATSGSGRIVLNCENNSHGITLKGPPHSANADYTLTLPNTDGNSGQAIITDGSGNLSFSTISGGSITTQRINTNSITAQKNYRYIIDYNVQTLSINITLPASPSTGDTIRFFSRYNNRLNFSSAGTETITRAGFTPEPYTELINLTSGVEIKAIYSGTEWVIESPVKEVVNWTSNTSINATAFLRYNTIMLAYGNATYTLPNEADIPDGTFLDIIFTAVSSGSSINYTVNFNAYNGNNQVSLAGSNNIILPTSSVSITNPRFIKIYKHNSSFLIVNPVAVALNAIRKNAILATTTTSSSSFTASRNVHYILESSASQIDVTLPAIANVDIADEFVFSRNSHKSPGIVTVSLDSNDASTSQIYIQAPGLGRFNNSGTNSISVPLTTGHLMVKKIFDNSIVKEYLLTLLQSGFGPIVDVTTTTQTVSLGYNYLIDTATAGGTVTVTLPYVDDETVCYETFIKVIDDTYDVVIDTYGSQVKLDADNGSITLKAGNSKNRSLSIVPSEENNWKILSDTHTNSNNYIEEITSSTTVGVPNYGASSETYSVNHATNAITLTLPSVANVPRNFIYKFKRIGAGTVTIQAGTNQYVDHSAQTSISISSQYDTVILQNTGSFWLLLS